MNLRSGLLFCTVFNFSARAQTPTAPTERSADQPDSTLLATPIDRNKSLSLDHSSNTPSASALPLTKGHGEISGGFSFSHVYRGTDRSTYNGSLEYSRFLADGLSLGVRLDLEYDGDNTYALAGAVGSYYFFQQNQQAARFVVTVDKGMTEETVFGRTRAELRYEFFGVGMYSFGPYLAFTRYIRDNGSDDYNRLTAGGRFNLYF